MKNTVIIDENQLERIIMRITHEIAEKTGLTDIAIVGVRTRGVPLARRICDNIKKVFNVNVDFGVLDITLYRDDFSLLNEHPVVNASDIPFVVDKKTIILCDDVLFTGRTVRASMDCLMQMGRPNKIQLAVVVDRGHRELPIRADYVGKNVPTSRQEKIVVKFEETDGKNEVILC